MPSGENVLFMALFSQNLASTKHGAIHFCVCGFFNAYTECLNGLIKIANRMGRGYSYEIIRAKTLYAKHARKVGSGVRLATPSTTEIPTKYVSETVEYGPHIPTLIEFAEEGGFD